MSNITHETQATLTSRVARCNDLLLEDRHVMAHFPQLLNPRWCDAVGHELSKLSLKPYEATVGSTEYAPIPKLGPALFEYHEDLDKPGEDALRDYFDQADEDSRLLRRTFANAGVPDPLDVLHNIVSDLFAAPVTVATEGSRSYFSGVVRDINRGAIPHYDDASVDTPHLTVGRTDRQLSILLYMTDFAGGELTSYKKKPDVRDNTADQLSYGYTWESVDGVPRQTVAPAKGSVVVFNPRYLHSVAAVEGKQRRLTVSAFVGRTAQTGKLISWS